MLIPHAIETKGGNFLPVIRHTERKWFQNETFPRRLKRTRDEALAYAEKVVIGRKVFGPERHRVE